MDSFYIVGGQQRSPRTVLSNDPGWYEYQAGLILRFDTQTGRAEPCVEYVSPESARGAEDPVLFKCASVEGDRMYACTQTEVIVYALPEFRQVGYVSLPRMNDVHHVVPTPEGTMFVANSGLEMVFEVTLEGRVRREWNVLGEEPWALFSRTTDYRKSVSTKPHRAHPNFVFMLGREVWATRFECRDAVSLTDPPRRIDLPGERVHDGLLHEGRLYFTSVDDQIVVVDAETLETLARYDLNQWSGEDAQLGWCRGVWPAGDLVWVGFSRIRPTKFREAVSWVRQGLRRNLPTRVAAFDVKRGTLVKEFDMEPYGLNAVFSILPVGA